jgi:hypothetical protein
MALPFYTDQTVHNREKEVLTSCSRGDEMADSEKHVVFVVKTFRPSYCHHRCTPDEPNARRNQRCRAMADAPSYHRKGGVGLLDDWHGCPAAFVRATDAVHSRTSYSNTTPSGSFSCSHVSAASSLAKTLRWWGRLRHCRCGHKSRPSSCRKVRLSVTGMSPPPGHRANELRYSLA